MRQGSYRTVVELPLSPIRAGGRHHGQGVSGRDLAPVPLQDMASQKYTQPGVANSLLYRVQAIPDWCSEGWQCLEFIDLYLQTYPLR